MKRSFLTLGLLLFLSFSCEKRVVLDTVFPHQENIVFCEVIGFINQGFFGTITQVQAIETNMPHKAVDVIIREEDSIIFDQTLETPSLYFPFSVKENISYSIEIQYLTQVITSPEVKNKSPFLSINDLDIDHQYIDSLGFNVASVSFSFTPPDDTDMGTDLFYTYSTELLPNFSQAIELSDINEIDSLMLSETTMITKRLPNQNNYNIASIGLLSIDAPFFQYLKNIQQLGIIPNDDIEGHHGNLNGGIGYFGVVNYDLEVVSF